MNILQGLLLLFLGIGLLAMDGLSLSRGWLPCGSNGWKGRLEFRRLERPLAYWLMFIIYAVAGVGLTVFAIRLLTGQSQPLPLR